MNAYQFQGSYCEFVVSFILIFTLKRNIYCLYVYRDLYIYFMYEHVYIMCMYRTYTVDLRTTWGLGVLITYAVENLCIIFDPPQNSTNNLLLTGSLIDKIVNWHIF